VANTVESIIEAFHASIEDGISEESHATLVNWINEAQDLIAHVYGPIAKVSFASAKAGQSSALPLDCLAIAAVEKVGEKEPYLRYLITEYGFIRFEEDGDYDVHYHKVPARIPFDNMAAVPEVHLAFHPIIHQYLLHKFYSKDPDSGPGESNLAEAGRARFYEGVFMVAKSLRTRARPSRKIRKA